MIMPKCQLPLKLWKRRSLCRHNILKKMLFNFIISSRNRSPAFGLFLKCIILYPLYEKGQPSPIYVSTTEKGHTALDRHLLSVYRQLVQVQSPLPVVYKNTCYTETLVCILRPFSFLTCHQVVM